MRSWILPSATPRRVLVVAACACFLAIPARGDEIARLIGYVKDGPSVYRTPEAVEYFTLRKPEDQTPYSQDRDAAVKSLRAAILLGEKGSAARDAAEVLVDKFPRAVHVTTLRSQQYGPGMGSFDDWLQTYALSAKSKFLLSAQLVEYATAAKCEDFIDVTVDSDRGGAASGAFVDIYVVITLNAGACGLTGLTGERHGTDRAAWFLWRGQHGGSFVPASPSAGSSANTGVPISSGSSLDNVVLKGRYRMVLGTGDELVGTVEGIDDSSVVLETVDGAPYKFNKSLVVEHELIALPTKLQNPVQAAAGGESEVLTFDQLRRRSPEGKMLSVRLMGGKEFVGRLVSVDENQLKLDIEGSEVPFGKEAIAQIATVVPKPKQQDKPTEPSKPAGPFDTLFIKNQQTTEYGRPLADLMYVGSIQSEEGRTVKFTTTDGRKFDFTYDRIVRRITHTKESGFAAIERYGKPLFCPKGMQLVDIPPGKKGRPFFKVCIDKYEYPNTQGSVPTGNMSYEQAGKLCEGQGKRLCRAEEWEWACSGLEQYIYPYGYSFKEEHCNGEGNRRLEPSGMRHKCVSKFSVYDMMGNIFEWVTGPDGKPMLKGGPLSKCKTLSPGVGGQAKPQTGFRCCQSN